MDRVKTYLVQGFLDGGKTTYIQEQIFGGYFHKRGSTLIISFEEGMTEYDVGKLREYRTEIAVYAGEEDVADFCRAALKRVRPDRVYVEMNVMMEGLREKLPDCLESVFTVTLIDGTTLPLYYDNMRQLLQDMLKSSHMAIINRCEDREALAVYGVPFRLMNPRCDYLRQSAMGYSEKAFGRMLPYDLSESALEIGEEEHPVFHLDSHENPENYDGKSISFDAQVRSREDIPADSVWIGRSVMTCCMQDIQFLGFECSAADGVPAELSDGSWVHIRAEARLTRDRYNAPRLCLALQSVRPVSSPAQSIIGLTQRQA